MKRARWIAGAGLAAAAAVAGVVGTADATPRTGAAPAAATATCTAKIGLMAPITGDAASIGVEQRNWARYALKRFNGQYKTKITLSEGDTQLEPAQATTVGRKFQSDSSIVGVVGPAGSQEVQAVGPIFSRAKLSFVSMSATRTDLTSSRNPTFFRVVPTDAVQGPTVAKYLASKLKAKRVLIVDDQTSYSTGLAESVDAALKKAGVTTQRESVTRDQTDYSSLVSKVSSSTNAVFLPWQIAANAQLFGNQMKEQGKTAKIFGSDGLFSPSDFTLNGAYVSSFAPDIRGIKASKPLVTGYTKAYNNKFGTFGPPTYAATWVVANAVRKACGSGSKASRQNVLNEVGKTKLSSSILGIPIAFAKGNVKGSKFFIFQIKNGKYTLVG